MKCEKCGKEISELDEKCPFCGYTEEESKKQKNTTNAQRLNIIANINLFIMLISSVFIFISAIKDYTNEFDFFRILLGIIVAITGYTLYLLLKTVVDIYNK